MKNLLKTILVPLLFVPLLFIISCSKDDDVASGSGYEFINQNAQGTIDGIAFNLGEGTVSEGNEELSIRFYDESEDFTDVCDFFGFGEFVSVFFSIPNAVGVYELSFSLDSFEGQTVTLFNPADVLNIIASTGAVEILTITDTGVTGRIDARSSEGNAVNGNFTVVFCP